MTFDPTEQLIREAFAEEADRAPDAREVMANLRRARPQRRYGPALVVAALAVVIVAVATFVVPEVFKRSAPPAADQPNAAVIATNVLVVGVDAKGYTDSIVLTSVGADGSVSLVSLPRDTWAQEPGGAMTKLNQVYVKSGIDQLVATVRDLTGITAEHYAVVDMAAVAALSNAVGGVPVCLKAATSDPVTGADFPAGEQVVTGETALAFLRQRHGMPGSDFDRTARLRAFLGSLAVKLRGADMGAVVDAVRGNVHTDDALDLLGLAQDLTRATSVHSGVIPYTDPTFVTPEGGVVIGVDPAQVKEFVAAMPGTPPAGDDVPCVN